MVDGLTAEGSSQVHVSHGEDRCYGLLFKMGPATATAPASASKLHEILQLDSPGDSADALAELTALAQVPDGPASSWSAAEQRMLKGEASLEELSAAKGVAGIIEMRELERADLEAAFIPAPGEAAAAAEGSTAEGGTAGSTEKQQALLMPPLKIGLVQVLGTLSPWNV